MNWLVHPVDWWIAPFDDNPFLRTEQKPLRELHSTECRVLTAFGMSYCLPIGAAAQAVAEPAHRLDQLT